MVFLLELYVFKYWYINIFSFENFEDELNSLFKILKYVFVLKESFQMDRVKFCYQIFRKY